MGKNEGDFFQENSTVVIRVVRPVDVEVDLD